MALVGYSFLPKITNTMLPMRISKLQKPKIMIVCATPDRPKTRSGSGGKINSTVRISTRTTVGVKEVASNTTLQDTNGEDNQKSKAYVADEDEAAANKGGETTE